MPEPGAPPITPEKVLVPAELKVKVLAPRVTAPEPVRRTIVRLPADEMSNVPLSATDAPVIVPVLLSAIVPVELTVIVLVSASMPPNVWLPVMISALEPVRRPEYGFGPVPAPTVRE